MKDINKVILIGRLGADPVQRETKNGTSVVHFPVATSRKSRDESNPETLKEETQWHRIVAWGKQGEDCATYLKKGQSVYVEGSMRSRKYDSKDGTPRMAFEVHAERVSFLGGGRARVEETQEAQEAQPTQEAG